jgi:DNA primase small subunit
MAGEDSAVHRTTRWLIRSFGTYYSAHEPELPLRYTKREWAFLYFDKSFMVRHLGFDKRDQILKYMRREVPRHAYYSTAYYHEPGARTMVEKGWQGATLVFDLDSDHLTGASEMSYPEMLGAVKREFMKLVDRWLIGKLGFQPESVGIAFSGGRGYHAHVEDPRVLELNSYERREVVDLITGKADLDKYLQVVPFKGGMRTDGRGYTSKTLVMPSPDRGDWRGDLTRATLALFRELDGMLREDRREEVLGRLSSLAELEQDEAREFLELLLKEDDAGQRRLDRLLDDYTVDLQKDIGPKFWRRIHEKLFVQMAGETDEPVTADTKRLIRLPGSIHGKSGLRVVKLTRDELEDFDPLTDAIAFGVEPVEVEGLSDVTYGLGGQDHVLEKGGRTELPEYAAVFACLRGMAQLPAD